MSTLHLVRRNSLFSLVSSAIRLFTNMLLFIGIARLYGPEEFGQFTLAHTYLTLFFLLADFGFDVFLTTEVSRSLEHAKELATSVFSVKIAFICFSILLMWALAFVENLSTATRVLMIVLSVSIAGNAVSSFGFALFKGHNNLTEEMRITFVQNVALLVMLVVLGALRVSLIVVAWAFVASRVLGAIIMVWRVHAVVPRWLSRLSLRSWKPIFMAGLPYGIHVLFGTLYFQLDTILLAHMKGEETVGIYQAAMKLVVLILVIPDVLVNATLPVLSRLHAADVGRWKSAGGMLARTLLYIGLPLSSILYLCPDRVVAIVYGSGDFIWAASVLRMLSVVVVVRFGAEAFALMLTTSRRQSVRMVVVIVAAALNLGLNLLLIPRYGLHGAAVASIVTNSIAALLYVIAAHYQFFQLRDVLQIRSFTVILSIIVLTGILLGLEIDSLEVVVPIVIIFSGTMYYFVGYTGQERSAVFAFRRDAWQ